MRRKTIRILCAAMAMLFTIGLFPVGRLFVPEIAEADGLITVEDVTDIIGRIYDATNGHYWNANKNKSDMKKAAERGDYAYGTTKNPCKNHNKSNSACVSNSMGGIQCHGFVNFVEYCIFKKDSQPAMYNANTPSKSSESTYNGFTVHNKKKFDYFENIKPGDILGFDNHTAANKSGKNAKHKVVVWTVRRDAANAVTSVTFIECNVGGRCHIQSRTMSAAEVKNRLKASNAFIIECPAHVHTLDPATGSCTHPACCFHEHRFVSGERICRGCGMDYYAPSHLVELMQSTSGVVTPRTDAQYFYAYDNPYAGAEAAKTAPQNNPIRITKATIVAKIDRNHAGSGTWYFIRIDAIDNRLKNGEWYGVYGWVKASDVVRK